MDEVFVGVLTGCFAALIIIIMVLAIINPIYLNEETAKELCQKITGNFTVEFEVENAEGKLVCIAPSYDNSQNIIFKSNGAEDG